MMNIIVIAFMCFNINLSFGYTITIGRSSSANYIVAQAPNTDVYEIAKKALLNISANHGGVLTFETGVYMFSANLKVYNNTSITGSGINMTTLKLINGAKAYSQSSFIYTSNGQTITVKDITLDGNNQKNILFGISVNNGTNVSISSLEIANFLGNGIMMIATSKSSIENSFSRNNGWNGIILSNSTDVVIKNNTVRVNGNNGFLVKSSDNTEFDNNTSSNNGKEYDGCGVVFQYMNVTATNNIISGNSKGGMCISSSPNVIMQNNIITYAKETGSCIVITNDTVNFEHTNVMCNGKVYVPKEPKVNTPKENYWTKGTTIIKIVIPCVIGIIGIVCGAQLIALYRKQKKEDRKTTTETS